MVQFMSWALTMATATTMRGTTTTSTTSATLPQAVAHVGSGGPWLRLLGVGTPLLAIGVAALNPLLVQRRQLRQAARVRVYTELVPPLMATIQQRRRTYGWDLDGIDRRIHELARETNVAGRREQRFGKEIEALFVERRGVVEAGYVGAIRGPGENWGGDVDRLSVLADEILHRLGALQEHLAGAVRARR
jgi:hypothetical protein